MSSPYHRGDLRSEPRRRAVYPSGRGDPPLEAELSRRAGVSHLGVAPVTFSAGHAARYPAMFAPELIGGAEPALGSAGHRALAIVRGGVRNPDGVAPGDAAPAVRAGWFPVRGSAALVVTGCSDTPPVPSVSREADLPTITHRDAAPGYGAPGAVRP